MYTQRVTLPSRLHYSILYIISLLYCTQQQPMPSLLPCLPAWPGLACISIEHSPLLAGALFCCCTIRFYVTTFNIKHADDASFYQPDDDDDASRSFFLPP